MSNIRKEELNKRYEQTIQHLIARSDRSTAKVKKAKQNLPEIPADPSLKSLLQSLTKAELDQIRHTLAVKNCSSLNKAALIDELTKAILTQLTDTISYFDQSQYKIVKNLVNHHGLLPLAPSLIPTIDFFQRRGLLFVGQKEGQKVICLPEEIREKLHERADWHWEKAAKHNTTWIELAHGLLFYYGIYSFGELHDQLEIMTGKAIDDLFLLNLLDNAMEYYGQIEYFANGYRHALVQKPEQIAQEQEKDEELDYYQFTKAQLIAAGRPDYLEWTPALREFEAVVKEHYDISDEMLKDFLLECINEVQEGCSLDNLLQQFQILFEAPSFEFLQQIRQAARALLNTTRLWRLKGHSYQEVSGQTSYLRDPLQPEPSIMAKNPRGAVFDFNSRKRIGRNDPCPCGSGKKYKKCCGRNLID